MSKFYAVKRGRMTGIFPTWDECRRYTDGYKWAVFKSFPEISLAEKWMKEPLPPRVKDVNEETVNKFNRTRQFGVSATTGREMEVFPSWPAANVDGSYNSQTGTYGYGGYLTYRNAKGVLNQKSLTGRGSSKDYADMRNIAGELFGAMAAIDEAMSQNLKSVIIYTNSLGLEKWATGAWKRKCKLTEKYYDFIQQRKSSINIVFVRRSGSGKTKDEESDLLAKKAVGLLTNKGAHTAVLEGSY